MFQTLWREDTSKKCRRHKKNDGDKGKKTCPRHRDNLPSMSPRFYGEEFTVAQGPEILLSKMHRKTSISNPSKEPSAQEARGYEAGLRNQEGSPKSKDSGGSAWSENPQIYTQEDKRRNKGFLETPEGDFKHPNNGNDTKLAEGSLQSKNERTPYITESFGLVQGVCGLSHINRQVNLLRGFNTFNLQNNHRNRRAQPRTSKTTHKRQSPRQIFCQSRIYSITILEMGDRRLSRSGIADNYVYDIEVEGAHTFYAGGALVHNCYIRRLKSDVLPDLPPKQRANIMVELDNRPEYAEAERDLIAWLKENAKLEAEFTESLEDMDEDQQAVMIADYRQSKAVKAARALQLTRVEHLKQLAAKGKIAQAVQWIKDFLDTGENLVVFASHIDIQKGLLAEFDGAAHILGEDGMDVRQANIDRFQDGKSQLIICSLKAAGVGITLTAASDVMFIEQGWTPAEHCLDEDTEILTDGGFRGVDDIKVEDHVAGFNLRDDSIRFVPVLRKTDRLAGPDETFYRVNTKKIDIVVTGQHRMVIRTRRRIFTEAHGSPWGTSERSHWAIIKASELVDQQRCFVPTAGYEQSLGVNLSDY
ncbi:MAG: hypothetical protein IID32_11890, partial [Planctomycetes bacterium]|nr:hypothetical protein [Planctomycetota bacterium]